MGQVKMTALYVGIGHAPVEAPGTELSDEFWNKFLKAIDGHEDITVACIGGDDSTIGDATFEYCQSESVWDVTITNAKDKDWNGDGTEAHYAYPVEKGFREEMKGYVKTLTTYCENGF